MGRERSRSALELRAVLRRVRQRRRELEAELMAGECRDYLCTRCKEPHHACLCDPQKCRGEDCTADVWWCRTPAGKFIAVEADGTAHWTNCVNAADFRDRRKTSRS